MILRVDDLRVRLGGLEILQGVSFTVEGSGVTALLGRNGAGKTTTLRAILGLSPSTGEMLFAGSDISGLRTHRRVQTGLGYVPEDRCVFAGLTVAENLKLAERDGRAGRRAAAREPIASAGHPAGERGRNGNQAPDYDLVFGLFPELKKRAKQKAGTLSGGQQQMLSLGRALLNRNRLLLIDEPTKGLAPKVVTEVAEVLGRAAEVAPVLLVEQNLAVVRRLAKDAVVLSAGTVAWRGNAKELLDDADLTKSLLGVGH